MSSKDYLVTKRELIASYYTSDEVEDKLKAKADNTVATQTDSGLMSGSDKAKLDGIEIGANNYTLPKADNAHLGGVKTGFTQLGRMYPIQLNADGQGYVEVPWTDTTQTYHVVTDTQDGLMSKTDKAKLDTIEENADVSAIKAIKVNSKEVAPDNAKTVDLTDDIQNMISTAVDGKVDKEIGKTLTSNDFTDTYKEKLDGIEAHADVSPVRKLKVNGKEILAGIDRTIDITDDVTALVNSVTANKVDKETGKSLTSNDFTDELKEKLDGIATGADVAPIQTISLDGKNIPADAAKNVNLTSSVEAFITVKTTNKVDKETGKSLTSNDFTDDLKSKLDGIAEGADVAPIATIKVNGTNQTITDRTVDLTGAINSQITSKGYQTSQDVTSAITEAINGVTQFEYEVVTTLPASGDKGKIYLISHTHGDRDTYDEYIYVDGAFEKIGNTDVDLTNYYKKNEVYSKQETNAELEKKVSKENGKSLTSNDFTNAYKSKLDGIAANANNYSLPTASKTVKGGLRAGYKETGRNYAVNVDEAGDGYVTVPWNDTHVVVNNTLTSDSTSEALSAAQGKALKGMVDGKAASTHTHNYAGSATAGGKANSAATADSATKLTNARQINGVAFDGTGNITITANPTDNVLTNQDLNEYTNNGFYHAGGGNTCKNKPADVDAFGLMVMRTATGHWSQFLMSTQKGTLYRRTYDGTAWGPWQEFYSTDHKPTPAQLGAATAGHTHNYAGAASSGAAANSAVKLANARTLTIGNTGKNFDGTANVGWTLAEIGAAPTKNGFYAKIIDGDFKTKFREQTKGDAGSGEYISTVRSNTTNVSQLPVHSSGLAFGKDDTHGMLYLGYSSPEAYVGGGNAGKLNWYKSLAFTDSNISGNAATATKLQTARTVTVGHSVKSFDGTGNVAFPLSEIMNGGKVPFPLYVESESAEAGKAGYIKAVQIKITSSYVNRPITIGFHRRSDTYETEVGILFHSVDSSDPGLYGINTTGTNQVWINKSAASTWDVYIQKTEGYDSITIDYVHKSHTGVNLTYPNTQVTALPTTNIWQASYRPWNGNAATATKLQTTRSINGTNFDGTANITTTNWGTARTITIGNTGKSVNGSANVTWSLAEIGASASGHTHNYAGSSSAGGVANSSVKLNTARAINGTNFDGTANITTANWGTSRNLTVGNTAKAVNGSANVAWTLAEIGAVNKAGDTMTGNLTFNQNLQGVVWSRVTDGASIKFDCTSDESDNYLTFNVTDDEPVNFKWTKTVGSTTSTLGTWKSEGIRLGKGSFIGPLSGNASTATKLATGRSFTIGNTAKSFDGSANVSWTIAEIGAAASGHQHKYIQSYGNHAETASSNTACSPGQGMAYDGQAMYMTCTYNDSATPASYGNILNMRGSGTGQLLMEWSGGDNTTGRLFYRSHRDTATGGWGGWKQVAYTTDNVASASTAAQLTTARSINGTNFNGTGNITTANWGTSRNLTVGNTAKAVNGSANVAWTLAEIGAVNKAGDNATGRIYFGSNDQNATTIPGSCIGVCDVRNATIAPNSIDKGANFYFTTKGTPDNNWWSILHVRGWTGNFNAWELAGNANDSAQDWRPYFRTGRGSSWNGWHALAYTTDTAPAANKLATARNIAFSGDLIGSANFDGSGNITINARNPYCNIGIGNTNNYPFHRFAYTPVITGTFQDYGDVFMINRGYEGGGYGIFQVMVRTNASNGISNCTVRWLARDYSMDATCIQAGFNKTAGKTTCDLYYKSAGTYKGATIKKLHQGGRGAFSNTFTMIDSREYDSTTSSDKKGSFESYTSVADGASKLGRAITDTIIITNAGFAHNSEEMNVVRTTSANANNFTNYNTLTVKEVDPASSNIPNAAWHYITTAQGNDANYAAQWSLGMTTEGMWYRRKASNDWQGWKKVVLENTQADTIISKYYKIPVINSNTSNSIRWMYNSNEVGSINFYHSTSDKVQHINFEVSGLADNSTLGYDFDLYQKNGDRISLTTVCKIDKNGVHASVSALSDYRLKKNIEQTDLNALSEIKQWDFKKYDWIRDDKHENVGLIAQQIKDISPSAVLKGHDGTYELSQNNLLMYALKAIQELQAEIEELKYPDGNAPRKARRATWKDDMTLEEKLAFIEELDAKRNPPKEQEQKETEE